MCVSRLDWDGRMRDWVWLGVSVGQVRGLVVGGAGVGGEVGMREGGRGVGRVWVGVVCLVCG